MRFSTVLPTAALLTLVVPASAHAGFVRVQAPPSEADAAKKDGEAAPEQAIDPEEEAMTLFRAGQIAYRNQDFRRALEFFQDAQSRHPSPIFHFNIGLCYEALEKPEQAIDAYRAYLRSGPEDRTEIEAKIKALEDKVAAEPTEPTPGPAPAPTVEAPPEGEPTAVDASADPVDGSNPKPGRPLIITGAALTAVGAVVAGGLGTWQAMIANERGDQVFAVTNEGNPKGLSFAETQALENEGTKANTMQITYTAAGAAVGLTGVALLVVGVLKNKKAEQSASLQVAPTGDRTSAGLSLSGRF